MSDKLQRTEGIILHSLPFRDYDKILTLFTEELGVVKVIMRKTLIPKISQGSLDPLTRAEFVLAQGKGDLFRCRDLSLQNQHLKLRERLTWLQAACDMAHAIQTSQMLQKPTPDLYRLFIRFLEKLPVTPDSNVLVASFYLKLLRHDGLLSIDEQCSTCQSRLMICYLARGESFCQKHAPMPSFSFEAEEVRVLETLNLSRSFSELAILRLSPSFSVKVKELFHSTFFV